MASVLDGNSSRLLHALQNVALIALSLICLPQSTFLAMSAYVSNYFIPSKVASRRHVIRQQPSFKPRTVLVTGVGMTKGLTLARLFYESGHNVIGADFESNGPMVCGRVSKSLQKFYPLQKPDANSGASLYVSGLLRIIRQEEVDIWVSCSGVASAVEDGEAKEIIEARTSCKAIQFNVADTQMLHEKHTFIDRAKSFGLPVPETHVVTQLEEAKRALDHAPGSRKFIIKPIGVDDVNRGGTLLPKSSLAETTEQLRKLHLSPERPWILQQYIDGPEYCTHSLVVKGVVKAFVACPSAELLMHYEALPCESRLSQEMLGFTREFAAKQGNAFTGHLSFDFMLNTPEADSKKGEDGQLLPIECNPRAHTAVALFNDTPELADAYLSVMDPPDTEQKHQIMGKPIIPRRNARYYWIGNDLVTLLLLPLLSILTIRKDASITRLAQSASIFLEHIIFWRDGTFERWDPLPCWWLYHVYWPMQFLIALRTGKKWSRVNVSTTKMFEC